MANLPVRCLCGKLEGEVTGVSPDTGNHITCYCDDCQTFQHYLGHADKVLNPNGGTEIFQMSPVGFRITQGREYLACLRFSPNGLVRWYASCCSTPIGNTLGTPALPFVGVITSFFDRSAGDDTVSRALGPLKSGVNGKFAVGDRTGLDASDTAPISLYFRFMAQIIRRRLKGEHKRSPFFDPDTGQLVVVPKVLTKEEVNAARRGAAEND